MNGFDIAAILIAIAAGAGYVNHRVLRLPNTSGTLIIAMASSLVIVIADLASPSWHLREVVGRFLADVDFNATLMRGMLCFLLFAGALRVDLVYLLRNRWTVGSLSTIGVLISTVLIGGLSWWVFRLFGVPAPLLICMVFGALISPTDPIAVMGLLKELGASKDLDAKIGGESLFNDGIGVVVFFALASLLDASGAPSHGALDVSGLAIFFLREVIGGSALGLLCGYLGYRALKTVDDHSLDLLMTLALVMGMYALSFQIHVSGPIAVVVAGIFIGNPARQGETTAKTAVHLHAFWDLLDEILNAVLFLLIGLQVFAVTIPLRVGLVALIAVPIALLARFVSVGVPITVIRPFTRTARGLVTILTWSGLRGGLSVAMVLSLPAFPERELLLASTYAVVVFSILVQGLTMRRVLLRYQN